MIAMNRNGRKEYSNHLAIYAKNFAILEILIENFKT